MDDVNRIKWFELDICRNSLHDPARLVDQVAEALALKGINEFNIEQNPENLMWYGRCFVMLAVHCHYKDFFGDSAQVEHHDGLDALVKHVLVHSKSVLEILNANDPGNFDEDNDGDEDTHLDKDNDLEEGQIEDRPQADLDTMAVLKLMKALKEVVKDDPKLKPKFDLFNDDIKSLGEYANGDITDLQKMNKKFVREQYSRWQHCTQTANDENQRLREEIERLRRRNERLRERCNGYAYRNEQLERDVNDYRSKQFDRQSRKRSLVEDMKHSPRGQGCNIITKMLLQNCKMISYRQRVDFTEH